MKQSSTPRRRIIGPAIGLSLALLATSASQAAPAATEAQPAFDVEKHVAPGYRWIAKLVLWSSKDEPALTQEVLLEQRQKGFVPWRHFSPEWSERMIPGRNGAPDVRIYIVNAGKKGDQPRPAILHMHGGGYVLGTAKMMLRSLQEVAEKLDCVIVSVDYRLAPETRFPGSLEDNYAGLKWLHDNAGQLGVDRKRIAVMGESAGGGHAAMLAIAARDRGEVPLVLQALVYPMLDDRTGSTRQVAPHVGTIGWTSAHNRFGWSALLGVPAGSDEVPYGAVPSRVEKLAGLAPAFIGVGDLDLFVDEDVEYARRLKAAGVPTELRVIPGVPHGFDVVPWTAQTKQFRTDLYAALNKAFGR